jgi:Ig-like domain from next to BRCA1 gene/Transglycosylase SLT domain
VLASLSPYLALGARACQQPSRWSVAAAFNLAANDNLLGNYPQLPATGSGRSIPPSVLAAVGWVESGWQQYTSTGRPLVSFDFGYGIMQITSGMAGAFGSVYGNIPASSQSEISSNYKFNIAYGAKVLAEKFANAPAIGSRDPSVVENWYYALWAYNGWGWVNNPNNPRFSRAGTPATNPSNFPYQERVLYLVAHPPKDGNGNPLWQPVPVALPSNRSIGTRPGPIKLSHRHHQSPAALSAVYEPGRLNPAPAGSTEVVSVQVTNTGTDPWLASGNLAVNLTYHLFTSAGNPLAPFSPFSGGVIAFGQGATPLPRNLLPGQSATLHVTVNVPVKTGDYKIAWDLQQGTDLWFSQAKVLPHIQKLTVSPAGGVIQTATPVPAKQPAKENLLFVADTSFPDGSKLAPKQKFVKGWLVFNSGQTTWQQGWTLRVVSGPPFAAKRVVLPATPKCRSLDLVVSMKAPAKVGSYRSKWRIYDENGHPFGEALTLIVNVRKGGPVPTPVPTPSGHTPTPTPPKTPIPTPTSVG